MRNSPHVARILTVLSLLFLFFAPAAHASNHIVRQIHNTNNLRHTLIPPLSGTGVDTTSTDVQTSTSTTPVVHKHTFTSSSTPSTTSTSTTSSIDSTTSSPTPTTTPTTTTTTSRTHTSTSTSSSTSTSPSFFPTSIVAPAIIPTTTFSIPTDTFLPTTSSSDPDPTVTPQALTKTFWQNKGAVAATFTITSLIILGIFFVAGTVFMRRRSIKSQLRDDYFEKYNENTARGGDTADDISTHDITSPAAADAYPDREIHYGTPTPVMHPYGANDTHLQGHDQQGVADMYAPTGYGISYPPGTAYSTDQEVQYQYNTRPSGQGHSTQSESPFSDPVNYEHDTTGLTPPVAFREPMGRDQGGRDSYQTSIDSFYGAYAR